MVRQQRSRVVTLWLSARGSDDDVRVGLSLVFFFGEEAALTLGLSPYLWLESRTRYAKQHRRSRSRSRSRHPRRGRKCLCFFFFEEKREEREREREERERMGWLQ